MILKCTCQHKDQDRRYGAGKRVHNRRKGQQGHPPTYRCTVCKKERGRAE
jgi:hypothetical protein